MPSCAIQLIRDSSEKIPLTFPKNFLKAKPNSVTLVQSHTTLSSTITWPVSVTFLK